MGNSQAVDLRKTEVPRIKDLLTDDPYLQPYEGEIRRRYGVYKSYLEKFETCGESLDEFSRSYQRYGLNVDTSNNLTMLEWAPGAEDMYLRGDFSMYYY